jgi:hypothetical protein
VGASIVMLAVVCALGLGTYSLRGQMQTIVEQLPEAANKLSARLASLQIGQLINMLKVQTAAREIEKATGQGESGPSAARQPATPCHRRSGRDQVRQCAMDGFHGGLATHLGLQAAIKAFPRAAPKCATARTALGDAPTLRVLDSHRLDKAS